jgi:hypothetical protein
MPRSHLSYRQICTFWLPLAGTWLMMAVEAPYLAAIVARLADPTENLAAFGVALSLAVIIEAPVIMLMSASTALVTDKPSYLALRRFTFSLSAILTLLQLVVVLPPVFDQLAISLIGLPPDVASLAHQGLALMLPWPVAIGYRRFLQGLLIRHNLTRRVAYGTVLRLVTMTAVAALGTQLPGLAGVHVATLALAAGVIAEAIASRWMTREVVARLTTSSPTPGSPLDLAGISSFYLPLALTTVVTLSVQPTITFFLVHARYPVESLAVIPVVHGLTFLFRALGLSYQEVGITLFGDQWEHYRPVRNFGIGLALTSTLALAAIAYTPLANVWFEQVSGLTPALAAFAEGPTRILAWMPLCSVWIAFQRSTLLHARETRAISWSSLAELLAAVGVLTVTIFSLSWVGATAAAAAMLVGRIAGNLWLIAPAGRLSRRARVESPSG